MIDFEVKDLWINNIMQQKGYLRMTNEQENILKIVSERCRRDGLLLTEKHPWKPKECTALLKECMNKYGNEMTMEMISDLFYGRYSDTFLRRQLETLKYFNVPDK